MRPPKVVKKVNDAFEKINDIYQELLDADIKIDFQKLEYVYKRYCRLLSTIDSCLDKMKNRQLLIESHFSAPYIPLNIHEQYHEVGEELQALVSLFFTESKTFLNDLTRFYIEEIENADKRGITPKSFGSCLNSINKNIHTLQASCEEIYEPFLKYGEILDSGPCFYRDKFIEHSQSLTSPKLSTSLSSVRLVHMKSRSVGRTRSLSDREKANHAFLTPNDMIQIEECPGKTHCFVHVLSFKDCGQKVVSGDVIGKLYDSTDVHFKKYGQHCHHFPPLDENGTNNYGLCTDIKKIGESPDLLSTIHVLELFTIELLVELKKYKQNKKMTT